MSFKAQCPYCLHVVEAQEAFGTSGRCPKCRDFFTVAPIENDAPLPAHGPARRAVVRQVNEPTTEGSAVVETKQEAASETAPPTLGLLTHPLSP